MKTRVSFYTLGCRLNQSETAVVEQTFESDDKCGKYEIVRFGEPADVVVINTCTVTKNGDDDTRRLVRKVNRINPQVRIALVGCQAQVQKEKLAEFRNVQWIVGNAKKMDIAAIITATNLNDNPKVQVITPTIPRTSFTVPVAGIDRRHTRANLKIQDGCDFFCSFCEIPYARGRARSREFSDIELEAKTLVAAGHKELVITGINVGTYAYKNKHLVDVVDALEQIDGLQRIRISSIELTTIPWVLINKMAGRSKLCRYVHIPLQSGSDTILRLMKRKYSVATFCDFITRIDELVPQICIGTDIIVGFPGEGDEYFNETLQVLNELTFSYAHVFRYSKRHRARSQNFSNTIAADVIDSNSKIIRDLVFSKRRLFFESLMGTVQKVLFEQKKGEFWIGLTDNYVRVKVQSDVDLENQFLPVLLGDVDDSLMMSGVIIEKEGCL